MKKIQIRKHRSQPNKKPIRQQSKTPVRYSRQNLKIKAKMKKDKSIEKFRSYVDQRRYFESNLFEKVNKQRFEVRKVRERGKRKNTRIGLSEGKIRRKKFEKSVRKVKRVTRFMKNMSKVLCRKNGQKNLSSKKGKSLIYPKHMMVNKSKNQFFKELLDSRFDVSLSKAEKRQKGDFGNFGDKGKFGRSSFDNDSLLSHSFEESVYISKNPELIEKLRGSDKSLGDESQKKDVFSLKNFTNKMIRKKVLNTEGFNHESQGKKDGHFIKERSCFKINKSGSNAIESRNHLNNTLAGSCQKSMFSSILNSPKKTTIKLKSIQKSLIYQSLDPNSNKKRAPRRSTSKRKQSFRNSLKTPIFGKNSQKAKNVIDKGSQADSVSIEELEQNPKKSTKTKKKDKGILYQIISTKERLELYKLLRKSEDWRDDSLNTIFRQEKPFTMVDNIDSIFPSLVPFMLEDLHSLFKQIEKKTEKMENFNFASEPIFLELDIFVAKIFLYNLGNNKKFEVSIQTVYQKQFGGYSIYEEIKQKKVIKVLQSGSKPEEAILPFEKFQKILLTDDWILWVSMEPNKKLNGVQREIQQKFLQRNFYDHLRSQENNRLTEKKRVFRVNQIRVILAQDSHTTQQYEIFKLLKEDIIDPISYFYRPNQSTESPLLHKRRTLKMNNKEIQELTLKNLFAGIKDKTIFLEDFTKLSCKKTRLEQLKKKKIRNVKSDHKELEKEAQKNTEKGLDFIKGNFINKRPKKMTEKIRRIELNFEQRAESLLRIEKVIVSEILEKVGFLSQGEEIKEIYSIRKIPKRKLRQLECETVMKQKYRDHMNRFIPEAEHDRKAEAF